MKTGLVLEGGAMRGMFTAGVLDVMLQNNLSYDGIIGVSAGACFGCNYKSQQPGRAFRYNYTYCRDPRYCSLQELCKTGNLFGAEFCYRTIPLQLDRFDNDAFARSPIEFYFVCTDVYTGKAVYHRCEQITGEELDWMRASASMPLVSKIVHVGGFSLLDGGIADAIPLAQFQQMGYEKNVVILTQPAHYKKPPNRLLPLLRIQLHRYPQLIAALANRHERYNQTREFIKQQVQLGNTLVIQPPVKLPIGHVEHHAYNLRHVYEIGRRTAGQQLDAIQEFLARK